MAAPAGGYDITSSSSSAADGRSVAGFDNSGFNVNFGGKGGVTTGAAVPPLVWVAIAGVAAWLLWRNR